MLTSNEANAAITASVMATIAHHGVSASSRSGTAPSFLDPGRRWGLARSRRTRLRLARGWGRDADHPSGAQPGREERHRGREELVVVNGAEAVFAALSCDQLVPDAVPIQLSHHHRRLGERDDLLGAVPQIERPIALIDVLDRRSGPGLAPARGRRRAPEERPDRVPKIRTRIIDQALQVHRSGPRDGDLDPGSHVRRTFAPRVQQGREVSPRRRADGADVRRIDPEPIRMLAEEATASWRSRSAAGNGASVAVR